MSMGGAIYAAINHKKIRCKCCGKNLDMSVDVDSTEPEKKDEPESKSEPKEDEDIEIERKHYRKTKIIPVEEL